jgi:diketogulonate reductase-like aldo/keto reductase
MYKQSSCCYTKSSKYCVTMTIPQLQAMLPLNDGFDMPQFGLVSYRNDDTKLFKDLLEERLNQGIRHIEISDLFGNGSFAVESVLDGDLAIERKDIFITFKIWPKNSKHQELVESFRESLHFLDLKYVDLLLIHAPIDINNRLDQWKALEQLKHEGLTKSIGGCNMTHSQLSNLIKVCTVIPAVIEVSE